MLLTRMEGEAPAGYVAFVARHLEPLRRDAARVVGDDRQPDELYPDVLTDVAARWRWLELARTHLRRPGAAEACLRRAFARRSAKWRAERDRWQVEEHPIPVEVLGPDGPTTGPVPVPSSSAAVRLAPFLRRSVPYEPGPLAEAAVAWWHAYETRRRRWLMAALATGLLLVALLARAATDVPSSV